MDSVFQGQHEHNGVDQPRIKVKNLDGTSDSYFIAKKELPWTTCQDGLNYRYFFIAPAKCEITKIGLYWRNGGTSSTVYFAKDYAGGTSAGVCSDTFATNSRDSSKTYWEVPLETTHGGIPLKQLNVGDVLSCWPGGTLTNLKDLTITVYLKVL